MRRKERKTHAPALSASQFVRKKKSQRYTNIYALGGARTHETDIFFLFSHTSTFPRLDKPWSQVSSLLSSGSWLQVLSRIGFIDHTARRFFRVLLTHALALSASQSLHKKKSPRNLYEYALGGVRPRETYLYTRVEDNLIRHRGDRCRIHSSVSTASICMTEWPATPVAYQVIILEHGMIGQFHEFESPECMFSYKLVVGDFLCTN